MKKGRNPFAEEELNSTKKKMNSVVFLIKRGDEEIGGRKACPAEGHQLLQGIIAGLPG